MSILLKNRNVFTKIRCVRAICSVTSTNGCDWNQLRTPLLHPNARVIRKRANVVEVPARFYCFKSSAEEDEHDLIASEEDFSSRSPIAVSIPEVWPHVPVIAIRKNIVFPRFIKLLEVSLFYNQKPDFIFGVKIQTQQV